MRRLLLAVIVACRSTPSAPPAVDSSAPDPCAAPIGATDDELNRSLQRCLGVPAPASFKRMSVSSEQSPMLVQLQMPLDGGWAGRTDAPPPEMILVLIEDSRVAARSRWVARDYPVSARVDTLNHRRVFIEKVASSTFPYLVQDEIVWLQRDEDLVFAGRYPLDRSKPDRRAERPSRTFHATSELSVAHDRIVVIDHSRWSFVGSDRTQETTFERRYALQGDVIVEDGPTDEPPPN
jgi:hypothetical protein